MLIIYHSPVVVAVDYSLTPRLCDSISSNIFIMRPELIDQHLVIFYCHTRAPFSWFASRASATLSPPKCGWIFVSRLWYLPTSREIMVLPSTNESSSRRSEVKFIFCLRPSRSSAVSSSYRNPQNKVVQFQNKNARKRTRSGGIFACETDDRRRWLEIRQLHK